MIYQATGLDHRPVPASSTAVPALELQNVSKFFTIPGGWRSKTKTLKAVENVSLKVQTGEVLAIVGESGSGKTTLSRIILGLQTPTSGKIFVDGRPLEVLDRLALSRKVQPVFQDPYSSLNPRQSVGQIIMGPLEIHRIGSLEERRRRVDEMMDHVGLARRLIHSFPSQLSGGQRQRVAIARALAIHPEILICDEPTSALDVSVQAQILNLLKDLRDEFNLTYLFITHDLSVVEYLADHVGVMYMGRLVEFGVTNHILKSPRHRYTQALLRSVLTPVPGLGLPELNLGRGFPDPINPPPGCHFHPRCPDERNECKTVSPPMVTDEAGFVECHLLQDQADCPDAATARRRGATDA